MDNFDKAMNGYLFVRGNSDMAKMRMTAKDQCFQLNQLLPSKESERQEIIHQLIGQIKGSITINSPFYCDYGKFISVGDNFFANYNCTIVDGGKVTFGDNVLIGPNCTFATPAHPLDPQQRLDGLEIFLPIEVGDNVWFGSNVTVLGGVHIGSNSVIAAGSVVTRDIPDNVLACGVPCKVLRPLSEKDKEKYPFAPEK